MAVTRSKSGTHPTPAPPATTPKQPAKRKSTSASKPSKVAKTEDKPQLAEAKAAAESKAAAEAALTEEPETASVNENDTKDGGMEPSSSSSRAGDTSSTGDIAALEAEVKEPAPETAPMPDVTTVLETSDAAQKADITAVTPSEAVASTSAVVPPAPTAPAAATIPAPVTQEAPATTKHEPVVASSEEPSAHTDNATSSIKAYDVVVSDIEGTTTPISFVKDTLVSGTTALTPGNTDINLGSFMPTTLDMPAPAPNMHSTASFASYLHLASQQAGAGMTPLAATNATMFPYVTAGLVPFLQRNWGAEELQKNIQGLREQAAKDVADGVPNAVAISVESAENPAEKVQQDVVASIGWQMKADRKIGALKDFQGYMWKEGYGNGNLLGEVYDDVTKAFDEWKQLGKKLHIYSSGSVAAQKLLFGYSTKGDLLHYFSGHYDTKIGLKVEKESYTKIAQDIGVEPSKILFLSDNIHEIKAAKEAGMQAIVVDRPGNAELSAEDRANHLVVTSFADIPRP
ncbi:Enolase-phosphatase E1 [Actinomortierella ambigua]|nr:Enolase-phosphatase E1 [Actinomortierella ambigua]